MQSQIVGQISALHTLLLIVDVGSLTEAARRLGMTPSGVSKQLGRLEDALGARLLERTTRRVRPTLAGRALCQRTRPLFEGFEDAARALAKEQETIAGRVRISASPAFGRAVVLPALGELALVHPDLRFDVVLTARRLDFVEDDLDLAIREGTLEDSTLVARSLASARVALYASPAYVNARGLPRSVADLARHDIVSVPATVGTRQRVEARLRKVLLAPRFLVDDLFAVAELAGSGAGIAPLPDYVARSFVESGALAPVLPKVEVTRFPIHAVTPSRRHLPRRVQIVVEALAARLSAQRGITRTPPGAAK